MRHSAFLLVLSFLLISVGCVKEESAEAVLVPHTLNASVEDLGHDTRVGFNLNNDAAFFWTSGDAIAVGPIGTDLYKFSTSDETGSETAKFTGYVQPGGYAVYPFRQAREIEEGVLKYEFDDSYTYASVDENFFEGMSVEVPMWAKIVNEQVYFKHLGGVVAIKVPEMKAGDGQILTVTSDKKISGQFKVDLTEGEFPEFKTVEQTEAENKVVTIKFSLKETQDAVFYVPVPTGKYELSVSVKNGEEVHTAEITTPEILRKHIICATLRNLYGEGEGGESGVTTEIVESAEDVLEAMKDMTSVSVKNVSGNSTIEIPKKSENTEEVHTLTISSISDAAVLEIVEDESGEGSSIKNLVVKIPASSNVDVQINMPNTTVSIETFDEGTLSLDEVNSSTADETLIVGTGVTIENLIVKKGSVRFAEGATVVSVSRDSGNSDSQTLVLFEKSIPSGLTSNDSKLKIRTVAEHEFITGMSKGGTIVVADDIVLKETVTVPTGVNVILDLNGKTISQEKLCSASYEMIKNNGTLTITGNGKISFKDTSAGGIQEWGSYIINNTGTFILENGTLEHLGSTGWVERPTNIPIQNYAGKVIVNGGLIYSHDFRSLRDFTAGGEVFINGGTFKGQVWIQGLGNGESDLTITGGDFSPTYGYDGSSVYISNGTNKINVSVTDGKFNTKIGCLDPNKAGVKGCITGGTFTETAKTSTATALLAEGYSFVVTGDGNYIVSKNN